MDGATREDELRCSVWTEAQGVDPIGSAPRFDALLLVEWPLPWPKDVAEIPELADAAGADPLVRVMAVLPQPGIDDGLVGVVHHRKRPGHGFTGVDHRVAREEVPALLARLLADPQADSSALPSAAGTAPDDLLVCGHGRRDPCCGRWGTLLQVEAAARLPDQRVWRCSHTGGHRFAPTAITLPEGRAWAWADVDLLAGIARRALPVADLAERDRGSVLLDEWAQPVERALFRRHGWDWLATELLEVATEVGEGRRHARVALRWRAPDGAEHRAEGHVTVSREVPVLVCGEPPEHATKTSRELTLQRLAVDGADRSPAGGAR
jgi:hypothetical protein